MFDNAEQVFEFITDTSRSAESIRQQLGQRMGIDGCYYEGVQWINPVTFNVGNTGQIARLPVDYTPNATDLRAIANEVSRLTQKAAATTHPDQMDLSARPPERDTSADASFRAAVHETVVNTAIANASYLRAAQMANHRRCIFGTWGVGLAIEHDPVTGQRVCAFDYDPCNLILDPACQSIDLKNHNYVTYTDTWTLDRIKSVYGIKIDPALARTMEQLEPVKMEINRLSSNRLFSRYARCSRTKAARVYQVHIKTGYRFDQWYIVVETGNTEKQLVNKEDVTSPFAGPVGLPFVLLHGYLRSDTMWSWGEPAQIKDEQDKANLVETQFQRMLRDNVNPKWIVDQRAFGPNPQKDQISKQFTNQVGGVVIWNGSDRQRGHVAPQMVPPTAPPQGLTDAIDRYRGIMREKTHRAAGNFGETPTHVPFKTTERALDDADQVASVRVSMDVEAHQDLIRVLHGTTLKLAQARNPATLAMLRREGLDAQDFAVVAEADPMEPGVTIEVQAGSIRHQTQAAKRQRLETAANLQMVTAEQYQRGMAAIEEPVTDEDRRMTDAIQREVQAILYGQEWQPKPMGRWTPLFIDECTQAQFSQRAKADPGAPLRLVSAIEAAYNILGVERQMADPSAGMGASGGEPGNPQGQPAPEQQQAVSVSDVLAQLSGGGSGAGAQVPAPAA